MPSFWRQQKRIFATTNTERNSDEKLLNKWADFLIYVHIQICKNWSIGKQENYAQVCFPCPDV